jgi:hypothetical protein
MASEVDKILAPKIPEARELEAADCIVMHRSNSYVSSEEVSLLYDQLRHGQPQDRTLETPPSLVSSGMYRRVPVETLKVAQATFSTGMRNTSV